MITVEIDSTTGAVVNARRYQAADLYAAFSNKWESKYRYINSTFAAWGGKPADRYDRGWTIGSGVSYIDVTDLLVAAEAARG
ncbi:MAG: hypothetical protein ACR2KJ_09085 [Jatrophihabitans sp.]